MSKAEEIFNSLSDSPKSAASTLRDYAVDMEQENADLRAQLAAANMRVSELEGITAFDSALSEIEARGRRITELERKLAEQDASFDETIGDRDVASNSADELAEEVARFFGVDIGEHSNMNDPWENAYEAIPRETLSQLLSEAREAGVKETCSACYNTGKADGLSEAREKAVPEWISVNDRLPLENGGTVAVMMNDGSILLTAWPTYWHGKENSNE